MSKLFDELPVGTKIAFFHEGVSISENYTKVEEPNFFRRKHAKTAAKDLVIEATDVPGEFSYGWRGGSSQRWKGTAKVMQHELGSNSKWPSILPVGTIVVSKAHVVDPFDKVAVRLGDADSDGDQRWFNKDGHGSGWRKSGRYPLGWWGTRKKNNLLIYIPGISAVTDLEALRLAKDAGLKFEDNEAASMVLAANAARFFVEEWT